MSRLSQIQERFHPCYQISCLDPAAILPFCTLHRIVPKNIATGIPYPTIEKTVPQFLTENEYIRLIRHFTGRADSPIGLGNLIIMMMPGTLSRRTRTLTAPQYFGYPSDMRHLVGERKGPPTPQHGFALQSL
ncbi:MAG: hypothetical protein DSY90_14065 [Deltaproteobacteria bacterium]|nr:MAG: hypothetical protein DSY90_14065 [Deltaproteobacteria bacterium]